LVRSWEQKSEKKEFFRSSREKGTIAKIIKLIQGRKYFLLREDGTRGRLNFNKKDLVQTGFSKCPVRSVKSTRVFWGCGVSGLMLTLSK